MKKSLLLGFTLCLALLFANLISAIYEFDIGIHISERFLPISHRHWLGTDHLGRDEFHLIMAGSSDCFTTAIMSVLLGLIPGVALGLWSAMEGGYPKLFITRLSDILFALPTLLLALGIASRFGAGRMSVILALSLLNVPVFANLTLAGAEALQKRQFVKAARALGQSSFGIMRLHILPNLSGLILTQAATQMALAILASASLAYLGLGTQPPQASWGRMLTDAQAFLFTNPQLALMPGIAIVLTVLGFHLLGEGLQDHAGLLFHHTKRQIPNNLTVNHL